MLGGIYMKKLFTAFLIAVCALSAPVVAAEIAPLIPTDITVIIDLPSNAISVPSVNVNGRMLVQIRDVAESIGADVYWDEQTQKVTLKRASKVLELTIGSDIMMVNGTGVTLDAASTIVDGRTYVPIRAVMEQFSQKVNWDEVSRTISINENFDEIWNTNLNLWILALNAHFTYRYYGYDNPDLSYYLSPSVRTKNVVTNSRNALSRDYECDSREELIEIIVRMTENGHNTSFMRDAALVNSLTESEYEVLLSLSSYTDRYMWENVKNMSAKWGDRGIVAWDLYRMANLTGVGYRAGYLEFEEIYELVRPIVKKMQSTFSSWDEANDNYLDGYAYWSRTDFSKEDSDYYKRKQGFADLREYEKTHGVLFDDTLWGKPVE